MRADIVSRLQIRGYFPQSQYQIAQPHKRVGRRGNIRQPTHWPVDKALRPAETPPHPPAGPDRHSEPALPGEREVSGNLGMGSVVERRDDPQQAGHWRAAAAVFCILLIKAPCPGVSRASTSRHSHRLRNKGVGAHGTSLWAEGPRVTPGHGGMLWLYRIAVSQLRLVPRTAPLELGVGRVEKAGERGRDQLRCDAFVADPLRQAPAEIGEDVRPGPVGEVPAHVLPQLPQQGQHPRHWDAVRRRPEFPGDRLHEPGVDVYGPLPIPPPLAGEGRVGACRLHWPWRRRAAERGPPTRQCEAGVDRSAA